MDTNCTDENKRGRAAGVRRSVPRTPPEEHRRFRMTCRFVVLNLVKDPCDLTWGSRLCGREDFCGRVKCVGDGVEYNGYIVPHIIPNDILYISLTPDMTFDT